MSLVWANGLLLVLVLIELFVLYYVKKQSVEWKEVIFNLNSGHILMWVLRGLEISAFYYVSTYFSFPIVNNWPYFLIWIFTFLAWDFCFYWLHRYHHYFKLLWAVHVVHHEGEHFNLSLGIRNSWYSSITSFPFFILLALTGVPVEIFIATSSIHYFIQFYNHNGLINKSGWLEKIIITPSHHRVHHGVNREYIDKNFGGTLVIWDKLFGTFQPELESNPVVFGVKNYVKRYNVLWANNLPFISLFIRKKKNKNRSKKKYNIPEYLIVTGGLLLFLLLLYYIAIEHKIGENFQIGLFVITFIGTIAIGGISEGRLWGFVLWFINFSTITLVFALDNSISEPIIIAIFGLLFIHSTYLILKCSRHFFVQNETY